MCCFLYIHICIYIYIHTSVVGVPLPGSGCQQHQQASVHQRLLERRPGARGLVPCVRARDLTEAEGHASAFITAVLLGIAFPRHVYLKARLDEAMFHFGCLVGLLAPLSCLATAFSQDGQECYSHVAALP